MIHYINMEASWVCVDSSLFKSSTLGGRGSDQVSDLTHGPHVYNILWDVDTGCSCDQIP